MTSEHRANPPRTNDLAAPRDQAIVHRLSQMTLETDLPAELEYVTTPRLEAIQWTGIQNYWRFMTNPSRPPPMPVPRSIMEPGDPGWTRLVLEEYVEDRSKILLDLYDLTPQERIQVRDATRHTILNQGQRTDATRDQMETYARRVILQLGEILAAGGLCLRATIYEIPYPEVIHACRFTTHDLGSPEKARHEYEGEPLMATRRVVGPEEILSAMPTPEARRAVEKIDAEKIDIRVYQDETTLWRIAAKFEYLWSEAQALRDADDVMDDHMRPAGEKPPR